MTDAARATALWLEIAKRTTAHAAGADRVINRLLRKAFREVRDETRRAKRPAYQPDPGFVFWPRGIESPGTPPLFDNKPKKGKGTGC